MRAVKSYFISGLVGLAAFSGTSFALADEQCKTLLAAGNSEYPPYLWPNGENDDLSGANVLILKAIGQQLGIDVEVKHLGSWARVQELAQAGDIDLVAGAFYTEPRTEYMDYVRPAFLNTTSSVWVGRGADNQFTGREDLVGQSVTTVINNSFGQDFDEFAKANLELNYVVSLEQAYRMLAAGRTDYVIYEKQPGIAYSQVWGVADQIELSGPAISSEGLFLTLSKRSPCHSAAMLEQLETAINSLQAQGYFQAALEQAQQQWVDFNKAGSQ